MSKKIYILCFVSLILILGVPHIYAQKRKQVETDKELDLPAKKLSVDEKRKFDYYF